MPTLNLGQIFPDFTADTSAGSIKFHQWLGDSWGILFSHPADFTPVCTTELSRVQQLSGEFDKRGCKLIALSCDSVEDHKKWIQDVNSYGACQVQYPIIADKSRDLAVKFGMLDPDEKDKAGMPLTCRAVFIIGPDKKLKLQILYPATTGRNFDEILRVLDSLKLTAEKKVATPVDWKSGGDCMVVPSLSDDDANALFKGGFRKQQVPSGKGYLRFTADPSK